MVAIRPVTDADVEALTPLKAEVHALHVAAHPEVFKAMTHLQVAKWLRERLAEETTHAWLAEADGALLGYAMAAHRGRGETTFSHARTWCEIDEVVVASSARRRGVARALIDAAAEHAGSLGIDEIELTTWAFNEGARAAFANMGFRFALGRYRRA